MPVFQDFRIGAVQSFHGPNFHGFSITDQHGAPLFSISFRTVAEAEAAHHAMGAALANAVEVTARYQVRGREAWR